MAFSLPLSRQLAKAGWKDLPDRLRSIIEANWAQLGEAWDAAYPNNPIAGEEEASDTDA